MTADDPAGGGVAFAGVAILLVLPAVSDARRRH
jgi:MYXO-CTERM domain-containing protein